MFRPLQAVLDAVLYGIVVLDPEGRVDQLNAEACRILEVSTEAAAETPFERLVGERDPIAKLVRRVLDTGRPAIEDEIKVERRYAGNLVVDAAVSPIIEADRTNLGLVLVLGDRTVRNALRDGVIERETLASYGHIAAGIAHEVKNPLSGIRGAAELLEIRAADDRARRTAQLIVREVDRITALVDELMVFARGEELQLQPTNVHRVLDQVLELVAVDPLGEKISVERIYDPSIPEFQADPSRLTQVFLNLTRNALQAMETSGSHLRVTTSVSLDQRIAGPDGRLVPAVNVTIHDDGPGISPENLQRLKTPFFTTKTQGTGLGLAVVRHWVAKHSGTMDIESSPGNGTKIRVSLPLQRRRDKRPTNKENQENQQERSDG